MLPDEAFLNGLLQIGQVAAQTGLSTDAIRFYERERLLHTAARSNGGFRLFSGADIDKLLFIRNAQELGFSLGEIRELLGLKQASRPNCQQVEHLLEHKIAMVRGKISSLRKLEGELRRAASDCQSNLRRTNNGVTKDCPVLAEISHLKRGNWK